jgi:hypothetical protein
MSYPPHDPYQQGNAHGVFPSSFISSNSDAVQAASLMSLARTTEGLLVHTRFSYLFKLEAIHW